MARKKKAWKSDRAEEALADLKRTDPVEFRKYDKKIKEMERDPHNVKDSHKLERDLEGLWAAYVSNSSGRKGKRGRIGYKPPPPRLEIHRIGDHNYDEWGCIKDE